MKRIIAGIAGAALIMGLIQWWRLDTQHDRATKLSSRIAAAQLALAASPFSTAEPVADASRSTAEEDPGQLQPLKVDEFFGLAVEISRMTKTLTAGDDRTELRRRITSVFSRLPATPLPELRKIMERLDAADIDVDGKDQISTAIIHLLADADPAATVNDALRYRSRPAIVESTFRRWSEVDPQAAAEWLQKADADGSLPPSPGIGPLRRTLIPHLLAAHPGGEAAQQLLHLPPAELGPVLEDAAGLLATTANRRALLERLSGTEGLPENARELFLERVALGVSVSEAAALLSATRESFTPEAFNRAAVTVATSHIDAETPRHAGWLLDNLRGSDRGPAIDTLIRKWAKADFNMAAAWLRELPASEDRNLAVAGFALEIAAMEPPSAVDWAADIPDPVRKADLLQTLYHQWSATSPEAAATYFTDKGLPVP